MSDTFGSDPVFRIEKIFPRDYTDHHEAGTLLVQYRLYEIKNGEEYEIGSGMLFGKKGEAMFIGAVDPVTPAVEYAKVFIMGEAEREFFARGFQKGSVRYKFAKVSECSLENLSLLAETLFLPLEDHHRAA